MESVSMKLALKPMECSLLYRRRMEEKPPFFMTPSEASDLSELLSNISHIKSKDRNPTPQFPIEPIYEKIGNLPQLPHKDLTKLITNG